MTKLTSMFTPFKASVAFFLRMAIVIMAILSLLTGCKSSRGGVKRGGGGSTVVVNNYDRKDYAKEVDDPMRRALVSEAQRWLGTKYMYGGDSKSGTDCSGLVMRVYATVCGLKLPRTTREQVKYCTKMARNKIRPGDLVFFAPVKSEDKVSHVGLYVGEGRMIHASSSRGVIVSDFDEGYWGERYLTGARVDGANFSRNYDSKPQKNESVKKESFNKEIKAGTVSAELPERTDTILPQAGSTIDLLDLIINQKVDSVFSSSFTD